MPKEVLLFSSIACVLSYFLGSYVSDLLWTLTVGKRLPVLPKWGVVLCILGLMYAWGQLAYWYLTP